MNAAQGAAVGGNPLGGAAPAVLPPLPIPPNPIHGVLQVCGINAAASRDVFIVIEGLDTMESFALLSGDTDVTEMAKRMASRSVNGGRVILGTMHIKKIQALVFWVKDLANRGITPDPDEWDVDEMAKAMEMKEASVNFDKIDVDLIDPGKCQTDFGWDAWQIAFLNKLSATMGAAKAPLSYVVRPDIDTSYVFEDDDEERMYQMPLAGENFKRDTKLVYSMLKAACVKTDAWTWIQDHDKSSNGRQAWLTLVKHYDGTGELNKRLERAKEEMNRLHYKDEKSYPFERYITKLKENFFILAKDADEALTGKQKVEKMMNGLRSTDTSIISARTVIYHTYRNDFDGAATFLSGLIANIHSAAQLDYGNKFSGKKRYVSATDTRDRDGRGGGRGRFRRGDGRFNDRSGRGGGRDGRGRGGRDSGRGGNTVRLNGIDVTDPNRSFTPQEWERLGTARSFVINQRNYVNGRSAGRDGGRGGRNNGQRDANDRNASAAQSAPGTANDNATQVSELTERGSQNGRGFGRGAYGNNNNA
jgi:hypothetical protein